MITLTFGCAAFPRHDGSTKRSCLRSVSLTTPRSRVGYSLKLPAQMAPPSFSASRNRRSTSPTSAGSHFGPTVSARLTSSLRLLFVRERGTSKDPLMKFPNQRKPVTMPSFSRILVEIALRFVTEPRTEEDEKRVGVDLVERCRRI